MKTTAYKITGADAVRIAERDLVDLYCYANPLDDGGIVSPGVGRQIVRDDVSLVYVLVRPIGWWDGSKIVSEMVGFNVSDYFSPAGEYLGPDDDGVEPRWS